MNGWIPVGTAVLGAAVITGCHGDQCASSDLDCFLNHMVLVQPTSGGSPMPAGASATASASTCRSTRRTAGAAGTRACPGRGARRARAPVPAGPPSAPARAWTSSVTPPTAAPAATRAGPATVPRGRACRRAAPGALPAAARASTPTTTPGTAARAARPAGTARAARRARVCARSPTRPVVVST
jgi:hypothetical protein